MRGCRGIKLWKDLSLWERDKYGRPIRTDDPRFDIIYDTAAKLHIPVLMHVADPAAFFTPKVKKMNDGKSLMSVRNGIFQIMKSI